MEKKLIYLFFLLLLLTEGISQNIFDQLLQEDSIACTLSTDIKFLTGKKHIEEYVPSVLTIGDKVYNVEIKTRGNARKAICFYPPFKIKFNKEELDVEEPNSFKMVNCCKSNTMAEQLLLKEYMIYKLYNIITPKSLEAILLNVTYEDSKGKRKPFTKYAIMLEDEETFAERFGGVIYEPKVTFSNRLDTVQLAIMTVFQYFIGNTDWAIGNQHNAMVVRNKEGYPFPVPYDFDYAGMVNADYAVPQAGTPIESVRERFNRGRCLSLENLEIVKQLYISKKEEIFNFVNSFTKFNKATAKETVRYLEDFYKEIENSKIAERVFCKDCKEMIK